MTTLAEVEQSSADFLLAKDIAPVLHADAHSIRLQAREDPAALGFPVICIGTRLLVPREGFLRFCRGLIGPDGEK